MIKEIKINSGKDVVSEVFHREGIHSNDLVSILATLEKCVEQYSLIIDILESRTHLEKKQHINKLTLLLKDLTKRELEVLRMAVHGLSNKEISDKLFISLETVRSHRKKIVSKIGIKHVSDLKDILLKASSDKLYNFLKITPGGDATVT